MLYAPKVNLESYKEVFLKGTSNMKSLNQLSLCILNIETRRAKNNFDGGVSQSWCILTGHSSAFWEVQADRRQTR